MNKLNFTKLAGALKKAGKTILKSSFEVVSSFGSIKTDDPAFKGRRTADNGSEYIMVQCDEGTMIIGLAKGTPKDVNAFEIKQIRCTEDCTIGDREFHEGDVSFKAYGIYAEEEE